MRKILLFIACILLIISCREYETDLDQSVNVNAQSMLTLSGPGNNIFVGTVYPVELILNSVHQLGDYQVSAVYTTDKAAKIVRPSDGKTYITGRDTMLITAHQPTYINVLPMEPGLCRLVVTVKDLQGNEIGTKEINFEAVSPDLSIMLLKDGAEIQKLFDRPALLQSRGNFVIRAFSLREDLSTAEINVATVGSSIRLVDQPTPTFRAATDQELASAPEHIRTRAEGVTGLYVADMPIEYDAVELGVTKLNFSAVSDHADVVVKDSIKVIDGTWLASITNAPYNSQLKQYIRPEAWAGAVDSIAYLIDVNYNNVGSTKFRVKFEVGEPLKTRLSQKRSGHLTADDNYKANQWYDFSNYLAGKIYFYAADGSGTYSDVVKISFQNGEAGAIQEYNVHIQFKQTGTFDFSVMFKRNSEYSPIAIEDGNLPVEQINLSEISNITTPILIQAIDNNPYSKFDYRITQISTNPSHRTLAHSYAEHNTGIIYGQWSAASTHYISNNNNIELFLVAASQYYESLLGELFIDYALKRVSDNLEKTVRKRIQIIDDRIDFAMALVDGQANPNVYQNQQASVFQLTYKTPWMNSDKYKLIVESSDPSVVEVYVANPNLSFSPVVFGTPSNAPASHSPVGEPLGLRTIGLIQLKGKKIGETTLSFTLRDEASGATKKITQRVSTLADPISYVHQPANAYNQITSLNDIPSVAFGETIHSRYMPRVKLRVSSDVKYSGNNTGKFTVRFTKSNTEFSNNTRVYLETVGYVTFDSDIILDVDRDYFYVLSPEDNSDAWYPINYKREIEVTITKADLEIPITTSKLPVSYQIREYKPMVLGQASGTHISHGAWGSPTQNPGDTFIEGEYTYEYVLFEYRANANYFLIPSISASNDGVVLPDKVSIAGSAIHRTTLVRLSGGGGFVASGNPPPDQYFCVLSGEIKDAFGHKYTISYNVPESEIERW